LPPEILVICPTRDRPDDAEALLDSLLATSENTVLGLYVDDDQRDLYQRFYGRERVLVTCGPRLGPAPSYNAVWRSYPQFEIYGVACDDIRFLTPGWDEYVHIMIEHFRGRIGVVSADHNGHASVGYPYVSRQWIEILGWLMCPAMTHFTCDTVIELLGDATELVRAPRSCFAIHDLAYATAERAEKLAKDATAFVEWCTEPRRRAIHSLLDARAEA